MAQEKIKIPGTLYRSFQLRKEAINEENRTVDMSFSSEHPVRRSDTPGTIYNEILDHNPKSMVLTRMNAGAPLLMHHNPADQVGIVVPGSAASDGKSGRCQVRFSKSARGEEMFQDVKDGIRGAVSVGYQVHAMNEDDGEDDEGVPNLRATKWEPMEVSLESLPADPTVGAGRSQTTSTQVEIPITRKERGTTMIVTRNLSPSATAGGGTVMTQPEIDAAIQQRTADAAKADKLRRSELFKLAKQYSTRDLDLTADAISFVDDDKTVDDFTRHILSKRANAAPITGSPVAELIGMNSRELNQYSICKAITDIQTGGLRGLEKEAHDAALKSCGRSLDGGLRFIIPEDVVRSKFRGEGWNRGTLTRDMTAGVFGAGGATIQTDVLGASLIELLRNKIQCVNAGARTMSGLRGNVAIPRQTSGSTAYWLGEIAQITESDQALNQLMLTPHRLGAQTQYSNLLLAQSTLDAEAFVRADLMKQLAIAKDQAALNGSGGAQPIGIFNTTGVGVQTVTAGTPTWAQMVGFETTVAGANADFGSLAYMVSTASRGLLKTTPKIGTTFPIFIWEGGQEGEINGTRALATNQLNTALNSDKAVYGNWEDLIFADWEGWEVLVNPYSLDREGEVRITIFNFTDIGIRHAGSFCQSNGSVI